MASSMGREAGEITIWVAIMHSEHPELGWPRRHPEIRLFYDVKDTPKMALSSISGWLRTKPSSGCSNCIITT